VRQICNVEEAGDVKLIGDRQVGNRQEEEEVDNAEDTGEVIGGNGITFAPKCSDECFYGNKFRTKEDKNCDHPWVNKTLNGTGEYILFLLTYNHRGYYDDALTKMTLTLQCF
jgi:hypothetical protein